MMPRQSTIKRLPPQVRDKIGQLLDQGRTLDEIVAHLSALDVQVSRSALGRYKQSLDKVSDRIRRSREIAEAMVRNLGEAPESKTARLNIELMHGVILDMLSQMPDGSESGDSDAPLLLTLSPRGAMEMAKGLDHLARAAKQDADHIARLKEEARTEAAEAATKVGRQEGLSDKAIAEIRSALGVKA